MFRPLTEQELLEQARLREIREREEEEIAALESKFRKPLDQLNSQDIWQIGRDEKGGPQ